jgi:hypothetical protein
MVWVSSQHDLALPTGRRLSAAVSHQVVVLAYSLVRTDKLPELDQLKEMLASPSTTAKAAKELADHSRKGFAADQHAGRLLVVMVAQPQQVDQVVSVLQGTESAEDTAAVQQFMHPIGE